MQGKRTLHELINAKACLQIRCRRCKHTTLLFPLKLIEKLGWDATVDQVKAKVRCSECGAMVANVYEAVR
jgi:ribosomal protein S27E